jgi:hypothetical protein
LALVILLGSGVVHGLWTDRWQTAAGTAPFVARLADVPRSLGEWDGEDVELPAKHLEVGEIDGYLARTYVNRRTGGGVSMTLLCGRPGPIAVHTPDVCYAGNGLELMAPPAKHVVTDPVTGEPVEFWVAQFRGGDAGVPTYLRVFWSWDPDGHWRASTSPRLDFARYPALYKMYVSHRMASPDEPLAKDPCTELLPRLLPELRRALFPEPERN